MVLAAGAWSGLVSGAEVDPARVKPVRGQMLELQLRAPLFTRLLKSAAGYVVPRPDGAVLVGSTMEMVGFDKNVTAEGLSQAALRRAPARAGAGPGLRHQHLGGAAARGPTISCPFWGRARSRGCCWPPAISEMESSSRPSRPG